MAERLWRNFFQVPSHLWEDRRKQVRISRMRQQGKSFVLISGSKMGGYKAGTNALASATEHLSVEKPWHKYCKDRNRWWKGGNTKLQFKPPDLRQRSANELFWIEGRKTSKCMTEAVEKKKVSRRDEFFWTALISERTKCGQGREALRIYRKMREHRVKPSSYTFVAVLKACVIVGDLQTGKQVHTHVNESDHQSHMYVGTMLVDMYVKCGSMVDACRVFEEMPHRDVVSWTAMILGYAQMEKGDLALQLYKQMQQEGVAPDERTFVGALKACSSLAASEEGSVVDGKLVKGEALEEGKAIHSEVVDRGVELHLFVANMLMDMYGKCGSMVHAQSVFDRMPHRSVVSWNAMILGYAQTEDGELALHLYVRMQQEGITPDDRTFVAALKACSSLAALEEFSEIDGKFVKKRCLEQGRAIHSEVVKSGFESDVFVGNMLVDMYGKCGSMIYARHAFDKLPQRDLVAWNALIAGYAEQGESGEAFKLFAQMQDQGLSANSWIFVSMLKACGNVVALEIGMAFHAQIRRARLEGSAIVANSLIDMYGKCGSMTDAQQVFDEMPTRDIVTWNALISGYARQGQTDLACYFFERMKQEGIHPDKVTFLSILTVCSHAGLVEIGQKYFEAMSRDYCITPSIKHYTCMVDLLGRAGQLEEAMSMAKRMPCEPNPVTWCSMLGACRKWNNVEMGRQAFDCVVRLDKNAGAGYVLMSNIYADGHMWEDWKNIQAMRGDTGAWKKPGRSWWTDIGGIVHTFVVGDRKHPESKGIYEKLKDLHVKLEKETYVSGLHSVSRNMPNDERGYSLCGHSEKLAVAYALLRAPGGNNCRCGKKIACLL